MSHTFMISALSSLLGPINQSVECW